MQTTPQVPLVQVAVPLVGTGHWLPQVLQSLGSLVVSTHAPLHSVGIGAAQLDVQLYVPPLFPQSPVGAWHATVHDPQVAGDERLASQPFVGLWSQSAKPVLHV